MGFLIITEVSRFVMKVKGLHIYVQKKLTTLIKNSLTHKIISCSSLGPSSLFLYKQIRGSFLPTHNMEGSSVGPSGSALYSEDIMLAHPCL